jgi:anaerobic carbon-monoxide dehydrogenase iron sulfur subunit
MKKIVCQIQNCLSCRSCELACATAHSQSKELEAAMREKDLPKHRVRIEYLDEQGDLRRVRAIAIQCRHCKEALCAQACITGGIAKDPETGDTVMDPEKCVGCWSCIMVCPVGAIVKNEKGDLALKCDHCTDLDTPACVSACPTRALVYFDEEAPHNGEAAKEK